MDTEDFETIPSSGEESSNSSEDEGNNKNVGRAEKDWRSHSFTIKSRREFGIIAHHQMLEQVKNVSQTNPLGSRWVMSAFE